MGLMAAQAAPVKTQLGLDELRGRARTLGQRHRTVLLLVDGKRPLSEVLGLALQAGAQTSHFEDLVRMGMVEIPSAGMVPDARDSAPSAFDALRVTSVELEVPAAEPPSAAAERGQRDSPAAAPGQVAGPAAAGLEAARGVLGEHLAAAASGPQDNPPSRSGALGPPVLAAQSTASVAPTDPSLQDRQLPLGAVAKPAAATTTAPEPARDSAPTTSSARAQGPGGPSKDVPSRRMPPEAPPAHPGPVVPAHPHVPSPARHGEPGKMPPRGKPAAASDLPPAAARRAPAPDQPRRAAVAGPGALTPAPSIPSGHAAPAGKVIPTLAVGSTATPPKAPARRAVLNRLASPRAGSLRVPDEPAETRLERVRELLVETLRIDAPLFGMRMLVRLRAAVSAQDLIELVWDIERHLITARHSRDEMLSLQRARELLGLGNTVVADDD